MTIDPSKPITFALFVVVVPAVVAGVGLLAAWRKPARAAWLGALALGLGYVAGHRASLGVWPALPPNEVRAAVFWVAVAAAAAGMLRGLDRSPRAVGWLALAAVACGAPWLLLRNLMKRWTTGESVTTALTIGVATLALASALDAWSERRKGPTVPLVLWLVVTAAAGAFFLTGSAIFAQFAGSLAAVLGAAAVFAFVVKDVSFARGSTAFIVTTFAAFCVACVYLSDLPRSSALAFFYAPLAAVALDRGVLASRRAAVRIPALLLATGAVAAVALWLAWRSQSASAEGY